MVGLVDILIPTLGRAHVLGPLVENIQQTTPKGAYCIVFVIDQDDTPTHDALALIGAPKVLVHDGTYPEKINAGYIAGDGEFVVPTADDVVFHEGWLEAALSSFNEGIEVVGTRDLSPATESGEHATMPILRRSYCEDPGAAWDEQGTVFHAGYRHNFCETETCQLAQHRGMWTFNPDSVIEHLHPAWGTREVDDTDRRGNLQGWEDDEALYIRRRAKWSRSVSRT